MDQETIKYIEERIETITKAKNEINDRGVLDEFYMDGLDDAISHIDARLSHEKLVRGFAK